MSEAEGCVSVWEWLCVLHLDQYLPVFQDAGFGTFLECQGLTQDQLETIGITLPGHRKRILASLQKTLHTNTHTHPEREHNALHTHLAAEGDQREEERAVFTDRPSPVRSERPVPAQRPVSRGERPVPAQRPVPKERSVSRDGERPRPVPKERTKYRSVPVETLACVQTYPRPNTTPCPTTPHSSAQDSPLPPIPPRSTPNCPPLRFIPTSPKSSPTSPKPRSEHNLNTPTTVPPPSLTTNPLTLPSPRPCPAPLAIYPPARHPQQMWEGGRKPSPGSPSSSPSSSSSFERYDQSSSDQGVPPLPPKVYVVGAGPKEPHSPAPIPHRPPVLPSRTTPTQR
ncbi:uncharacterized protein ACWYII_014012 [Salvelinus alpinus]